MAAAATALQTSVNTQVGVSIPSGAADNSHLDVGGGNWSTGAPAQQNPAVVEPRPDAPGGLGFASGAFHAATPNINANGYLPVAQNYLVTGNVNWARQTVQAAFDDFAQRIDNNGDAYVSTPEIVGTPNYYLTAFRYSALEAQATTLQNIDPLVLDLDGDGIELTSWIETNIFFDTLGDGKLHQTGWVADHDGILALDLDGNGKIDSIKETISVHYNGGSFADGIAALASLAQPGATSFSRATSLTNAATGRLYFDDLRVWVDANHDAKTDAGELKTLGELGVASISLAGAGNKGENIAGNDILNRTTFAKTDGTTGQVASVDFQVEGAAITTSNLGGATVIKSEGSASVTSYVVTDGAGHSLDASSFTLADGTHPNAFYSTTGNDSFLVDATDTRSYWLGGGSGSLTLRGGAGNDVLIINAATAQANIDGGGGFDIVKVNDTRGVTLDLAAAHVEEAIGDIGDDVLNASGMTANAFLDGAGGNDILIGGIANDAIGGGAGDDYIDGGRGNDILRGGDGRDLIFGGDGDDLVFGEGGDDTLVGGAVSGTSGANMLEGDEGNDLLIGTGGYTVARYRGSFSEYSFTRNADGTFTIADSQAGRDGTDTLKDISALEFADISQIPVNASLPNYGYGMPVNDRVEVSGPGPYVIAAANLLGNDKNYAGLSLSIRELLDVNGNAIARGASGAVVGGVAALSADGGAITFTPTAGFTGVMKFKYHISDSAGKTGALVQQVGTTNTAEVTGTVYLNTPDQPTEELFDQQWYLPETNILPVWKDYTGAGVRVAVFDPSGNADLTHQDLAANAGDSTKVNGNTGVEKYGSHATLVAGVIGAARDGRGVVGVAYNANISSIAIPTDSSANLNNLRLWKNYDVVNNSWNIAPAFADSFLKYPDYEGAYLDAVNLGRGGKGTILVFAAGNDRTTRNTNDLNETNSLYGITVAGINAKTDLASLTIGPNPFSTRGETILVSAPGSNITSTGELVTSSTGTVFGSDYATAEGTSFATPIVSGIAALMLEANPNLGYRDVQDILAYSARKVNDPTTSWQTNLAKNWNGGGLHYSRDYGFGEVDARAAVRLAETWQGQKTISNLMTTSWAGSQTATVGNGAHVVINSSGASFTYTNIFPISYAPSVSGMHVEHVEAYVDLDVDAYPLNDIKVILEPIHPTVSTLNWYGTVYSLTNYNYVDSQASVLLDGEQSVPTNAAYVTSADGHRHLQFVYGSVKYRGEDPGSDPWVLRIVRNSTGQEVAPAANWSIRFVGSSASDPQQWIFTDEYGGGASITPVTGTDSFNAAAATGDNVIDLRAGTSDSLIDGKTVTVNGNLGKGFGGDGNDVLIANAFGDELDGGRGNDQFFGGAGNDALDGGQGNDILTGGGGYDTYEFDAKGGQDVIVNGVATNAGPSGELAMGGGVSLFDLRFMRSGNDLVITVIGAESRVAVRDWFAGAYAQLTKLTFSDGSQIGASAIAALATLADAPSGVIENAGNIALVAAGNNYGLYGKDGSGNPTTGPLLRYQGGAVTAGQFSGWSPVAAAQTASGYVAALRSADAASYSIWSVDAGGNYVTSVDIEKNDPRLWSYETQFNFDLGGDGKIGAPLSPSGVIENAGNVALVAAGGYYGLYGMDGGGNPTRGPLLRYQGAAVTAGQFSGWSPAAAEKTASGYVAAFRSADHTSFSIWSVDADGNYISNVGVEDNDPGLWSYETQFDFDLDGDGRIGAPISPSGVIENTGNVALVTVSGYYWLYGRDGAGNPTTGPVLRYQGAGVTPGQFPGWSLVAAEQTASGYVTAFWSADLTSFSIWSVAADGNYLSHVGVAENDPGLWSYETQLSFDLDGDGKIGAPISPSGVIENTGNVALVMVSGYYWLYGRDGAGNPTTGPVLRYQGAGVTPGQFSGWSLVAAEQTASGYLAAFRNAALTSFSIWSVDADGNYVSNVGVEANDPGLWSYETQFSFDLDGDGNIGAPISPSDVIENAGNVALVTVGGYYWLYGRDGAGNPTTGPVLRHQGAGVTPGQFSGWSLVGAEATANGYEVALQSTEKQFLIWNVDKRGNYQSSVELGGARDNADGSGGLFLQGDDLTITLSQTRSTVTTAAGNAFTVGGHGSESITAFGLTDETFIFTPGAGQDILYGFVAGGGTGHDTLQFDASAFGAGLTAADQNADWQALLAHTADNAAGSAVITDVFGDSIILSGLSKASLTASDVRFV
ncbi:S8 family serine peptidase [Methylosinus sporium]|uniref:S8 family serine peptidase n=1 Tax=Methylosinus sporium TaxID=428 RepID=UPI001304D08C|nr:S8 family serine peptidase [Methylosinus sporium]